MKKHIHLIVPDKIKNPLGGMGVGSMHFVNQLKEFYDFSIIGFPENNGLPNYTGAHNPLPNIQHGSLITLAAQNAYFSASIKLRKPDLMHVYDWSAYLGGYYAADFFQVPLVVSMRLSVNLLEERGISYAMNSQTPDGYWIQKALNESEIFGLQKANHITQVSHAYAKRFEAIPGLKEKTSVVPNGIDLEEWGTAKKVSLPGTRKYKIAYIGRFAAMKGIIPLCEAKIPENCDLIFVGSADGGDMNLVNYMQERVSKSDNVHYVGPLYGQDKIDLLHSVDAVVMPSRHEPFGIVALEALASKSILISSFVDGMSDFLREDVALNCGIERQGIEQAFYTFSTMSEEEKNIRKEKGIEICKEYSWESASKKLKAVYDLFL